MENGSHMKRCPPIPSPTRPLTYHPLSFSFSTLRSYHKVLAIITLYTTIFSYIHTHTHMHIQQHTNTHKHLLRVPYLAIFGVHTECVGALTSTAIEGPQTLTAPTLTYALTGPTAELPIGYVTARVVTLTSTTKVC